MAQIFDLPPWKRTHIHPTRINLSKSGHLWVVTDKGVGTWDGTDIIYYQQILSDTLIKKIEWVEEDEIGNVYLASNFKGIYYFNIKTGEIKEVPLVIEGMPPNKRFHTNQMHVDRQGLLWVATIHNGFFWYNPATGEWRHYNLDIGRKGYWDNRYGNTVSAIIQDVRNDHTIWLATFNGIYKFDKQRETLVHHFKPASLPDTLRQASYLTCLHQPNDSLIWFGTWGGGIGRSSIASGRYQLFPREHGFKAVFPRPGLPPVSYTNGHIVTRIQPNNEHSYFVGLRDTSQALFDTRNLQWSYDKQDAIQQGMPRTDFTTDGNGHYWMVVENTLYYTSDQYKIFHKFDLSAQPWHLNRFYNEMWSADWDSTLQQYIISVVHGSGTYLYNRQMELTGFLKGPAVYYDGVMGEANIQKTLKDGRGRFWAKSDKLLLYNAAKGVYEFAFDALPKLTKLHGRIFDFNIDEEGRLLVLTTSGTIITVSNDLKEIAETSPVQIEKSSVVIRRHLLVDSIRNFWYGATEHGIFQYNYKSGLIREIPVYFNSNLSAQHINIERYDLDADGNLWIGSDHAGVTVIDPVTLKKKKEWNTNTGLASNISNRPYRGPSGYMFIITTKGLSVVDYRAGMVYLFDEESGLLNNNPLMVTYAGDRVFIGYRNTDFHQVAYFKDLVGPSKNNRELRLTYLSLNNVPVTNLAATMQNGWLKLPHKSNTITLQFSSIEYSFPHRLRFAYQMEGVDKGYVETDNNHRLVTYADLEPGKYYFNVKVRSVGEPWSSNQLHFPILIKKALWQTDLFIFIMAIISISVIVAFVKWRLYYLMRRNIENTNIKHRVAELEDRALRAQMNPHFIFNCLSSIKSLVQDQKSDAAVSYLTTFTKLIRYLMNNADRQFITLYDELEICRLYLALESLRFSGQFQYIFNIAEDVDIKSVEVPALFMQPFAENAVWHGLMPKQGSGRVKITVKQSNGYVSCSIDDNGIGRETAQKMAANRKQHHSMGMRLTQERLHLNEMLNQTKSTLSITDKYNEDGTPAGTLVEILFSMQ